MCVFDHNLRIRLVFIDPRQTGSLSPLAVNPVPMLLIATSTGVSISEFDSDLNTTVLLDQVSPSALAYLAQDNRTFWIEHSDALFVSQNSEQKTEVSPEISSGKKE